MFPAIEVMNLGKLYHRYHIHRPRKFKEALLRGVRAAPPVETFCGLRHVSFKVEPRRMFGIVPANGAGKSSLLRHVDGVGRPDEASVTVCGRVVGLLELGAGFHPDLIGRKNVFVNGVIAGLTRRGVEQRFDAIVDFAELTKTIDNPLRTYTSGMRMRLGFSVVAHTDPKVLLIDEILAVGDQPFKSKCVARIRRFKADGCAILFVSHNLDLVRDLCDETAWFRRGELILQGAAESVVRHYEDECGVARTGRIGRRGM